MNMKKRFTFLSTLLISSLVLLSACSQTDSSTNIYKVFEIKQQSYSNTIKLNHLFNLDSSTTRAVEKISNPKTSFSIKENNIGLTYEYTQLETLTGIEYHVYRADEQALSNQQKECMELYLVDDPFISFDTQTGKLLWIQYPFASLNVSAEMSNSEIRAQAETYLKETFDIDFTPYDQVTVKRSDTIDDPQESIGYWTIDWYRMEKGHKMKDNVSVIVLKNGFMEALRINPALDVTDPNLTQHLYQRESDLERKIIDNQIKTIYNTNEARLVSWSSSEYESDLFQKNGTWYIEYLVEVKYIEKATNSERGEVCNIVVEIP